MEVSAVIGLLLGHVGQAGRQRAGRAPAASELLAQMGIIGSKHNASVSVRDL